MSSTQPILAAAVRGGYCLTPYRPEALLFRRKKWASQGRHFRFDSNSTATRASITISPGNPLAVGHFPGDYGLVRYLASRDVFGIGARVLDLGAGQGQYIAAITAVRPDLRESYRAVDGALNVEAYTRGLVGYYDVCDPWPPEWDGAFEWLFSLEVAEHMPPACEANLLQLLKAVPTKGVILSWSSSYSPAHHPNAHPEAYVRKAVSALGFVRDELRTSAARSSVEILDYLNRSIQVFTKATR